MTKRGIVYKLIVTFTSITGVVLLLVGMMLSIWFSREYKIEKLALLDKQMVLIENSTISYLKDNTDANSNGLDEMMQVVKESTGMDTLVIDSMGYVYFVSNDEYKKYEFTKMNLSDDIIEALKRGESKSYNHKLESGEIVSVYISPIYKENSYAGSIIMVGNDEFIKTPLRIYVMIWIIIAVALVISSVIVYYFAQKVLVKPLDEINRAARKLAKGDTAKRVYIDSRDEIGELAESFNIMAESLEDVDKKRKDFISNVSHELRSPITSIKGFVAGILDGIIPSDKENFYLQIVYNEIDRLARLVNDLLDISAMESGKFKLTLSEFNINEIIRLCILNLESKINEKGLKVEVVFDESRQHVVGDRDRVIQIITNLIENAIKYSSKNGKLEINAYSKGDKVLVSIYNDGPIISKEDINNIWDRFYKSDKSRTNKISMGLGLSIVRLILSQHEQDIWVKNIDDKGVQFTFTLKRVN